MPDTATLEREPVDTEPVETAEDSGRGMDMSKFRADLAKERKKRKDRKDAMERDGDLAEPRIDRRNPKGEKPKADKPKEEKRPQRRIEAADDGEDDWGNEPGEPIKTRGRDVSGDTEDDGGNNGDPLAELARSILDGGEKPDAENKPPAADAKAGDDKPPATPAGKQAPSNAGDAKPPSDAGDKGEESFKLDLDDLDDKLYEPGLVKLPKALRAVTERYEKKIERLERVIERLAPTILDYEDERDEREFDEWVDGLLEDNEELETVFGRGRGTKMASESVSRKARGELYAATKKAVQAAQALKIKPDALKKAMAVVIFQKHQKAAAQAERSSDQPRKRNGQFKPTPTERSTRHRAVDQRSSRDRLASRVQDILDRPYSGEDE